MKCKVKVPILGVDKVVLDYYQELKINLILLSMLIGELCRVESHKEDELFLQMLYSGKACIWTNHGHMITIERVV